MSLEDSDSTQPISMTELILVNIALGLTGSQFNARFLNGLPPGELSSTENIIAFFVGMFGANIVALALNGVVLAARKKSNINSSQ